MFSCKDNSESWLGLSDFPFIQHPVEIQWQRQTDQQPMEMKEDKMANLQETGKKVGGIKGAAVAALKFRPG